MTDRDFEQRLHAGFRQVAHEGASPALRASIAAIPDVVSPSLQRRWTVWWGFPALNRFAPIALVATAVMVITLLGIGLFLRLSPNVGPSPVPHQSEPAQPKPAVFVFNKGAGTAAECGNSELGGCIARLWVANLDGAGAHELIPDQSGCQRFQAWSPDGTRLLFSRSPCKWTEGGMFGAERFYLTDAGGSEPQLVDTGCVGPCVAEDDAVFSSDGGRILFVRTKSVPVPPSAPPDPVTGKPAQTTEAWVLASMDLSTGRVTELGPFDECYRCGIEWTRSYPHWSPDRAQIVFTEAAQIPSGPQPPKDPAVFVADADGRNVHQVSPAGQFPAWSADGTRIVFQGDRYSWVGTWSPGVEVSFFSDIYTIRPDGTDLRRLTTDQISSNPSWSAAGRIWFLRTPRVDGNVSADEQSETWIMDADGSNATQLGGPPPVQVWLLQPTP